MGFFKKITKSIGGGVSNLINGKEKTYRADAIAGDFNAAAKTGIKNLTAGGAELEKIYSNPQETITNQIGLENKLIRGASDDAARRARQLITQRGMGSSSIGLGTELNAQKQLNDKLAMNNASGLQRLMDINKERMNLGNALMAPKLGQGPIQMNTIKKRRGGITGEGGLLDTVAPFAQAAATAYAKGG